MADKTPLKIASGEIQQFQSGDTVPAANLSDATTQSASDNSVKIATTAFVVVASVGSKLFVNYNFI